MAGDRPRCDATPAWQALQAHFDGPGRSFDLRQAFAQDPGRFERFSQAAPHVFADLSKNLVDEETEGLLLRLARECRLEQHRAALFAGESINTTEGRAVKHWLLRAPPGASADPDAAKVRQTLDAMLDYAERVRADR